MSNEGNILITFGAKRESYAINGAMVTVADAVKKFFGGASTKDKVVHVGGIAIDDLAGTKLRTNDVVLVVNKNLASGGYKQAA
jgi:hypothetical protein